MKLNPEIEKLLVEFNIDIYEGQLYLLACFHNLDTVYFSEETIRQVNSIGIVERDYKNER